jgi:hypothetical protein
MKIGEVFRCFDGEHADMVISGACVFFSVLSFLKRKNAGSWDHFTLYAFSVFMPKVLNRFVLQNYVHIMLLEVTPISCL